MDKGSFVETDPFAIHRAHDFGMEKKHPPGDGVITGYGTVDGRKVFVSSQDFTVFGGSMGEVMAQKVCKVMDLAMQHRRAVHLDQRLRRRADPGRRGQPRRLRVHLRAERTRLRRDPADQRDHGPVRGWRRLLPRHHRLHLHGEGDLPHVHHRARRDQDGDRRGGHDGGARRRHDARREVGRGRVRGRGRRGRPAASAVPDELPPVQQPGGPARLRVDRRSRAPRRGADAHRAGPSRRSPTTCTR